MGCPLSIRERNQPYGETHTAPICLPGEMPCSTYATQQQGLYEHPCYIYRPSPNACCLNTDPQTNEFLCIWGIVSAKLGKAQSAYVIFFCWTEVMGKLGWQQPYFCFSAAPDLAVIKPDRVLVRWEHDLPQRSIFQIPGQLAAMPPAGCRDRW